MSKKNLITADYSLNGSAFILGDTDGNIVDYHFFSSDPFDWDNPHCTPTNLNAWASTRLDKVMAYYYKKLDDIDTLVLEGEAYGARGTTTFKDGYAIIKFLARRKGVWYLEISPTSSKLYFADDARAKKPAMVKQAKKEFPQIEWDKISDKHQEDVADALSLFALGVDYYKCGGLKDNELKIFKKLPLHRQMVISQLKGDDKLHKEAKKEREKLKRVAKKGSKTQSTKGSKTVKKKTTSKTSTKKSTKSSTPKTTKTKKVDKK